MKLGLAILPLEVWADFFLTPWFTRQELAQILDNLTERDFARKIDKLLHGCGKQTLHYLEISSLPLANDNPTNTSCRYHLRKRKIVQPKRQEASLAVSAHAVQSWFFLNSSSYKTCKFPETEMPENITKFKHISIRHLDDKVLDFLNKVKPLFTNVFLAIQSTESLPPPSMRILLGHILPLLASIRAISCSQNCLEILEEHFPGTLTHARELFLPASATFIPTYLKWLTAPHDFVNGPRFLKLSFTESETIFAIVDAVRQQFLAATASAMFAIYLASFQDLQHRPEDEFKLENVVTNEQLAVRNAVFERPQHNIHYVEILRFPKGADAKLRQWVEQRAYYEKVYKKEDENDQVILVGGWWLPLTVGHITEKNKKVYAINEDEPAADDNEAAGPSTSMKRRRK